MRQQEFADRRIERKAVHALPRRVDEHRARAVEDVTSGDLRATLLQTIGERAGSPFGSAATMDRKDRPDRNVDVDVGRAIEWIIQQDVLPAAPVLADFHRNRALVFLRRDDADSTSVLDAVAHGLVREHIELLL